MDPHALFVPGWGAPAALYEPGLPSGWSALEPPSFAAGRGSLAEYHRWLRIELDRRGRSPLGGHSMGAALAILAAAESPELVERLVLVAPAGHRKLAVLGAERGSERARAIASDKCVGCAADDERRNARGANARALAQKIEPAYLTRESECGPWGARSGGSGARCRVARVNPARGLAQERDDARPH
ncbi:MAG TPA: hypothetical protein VM690_04940, partial [Gaiellaceae bacterium]|nr:hypothetical protein [Gaiellaceae bacterium]